VKEGGANALRFGGCGCLLVDGRVGGPAGPPCREQKKSGKSLNKKPLRGKEAA